MAREIAIVLWQFLLAGFLQLGIVAGQATAETKPWAGTRSEWNGFERHDFKFECTTATMVVPKKPLPGNPWVWRGEFFGAFADTDKALVQGGWHLAHLRTPDLFGSPKAIRQWESFHQAMVTDHGLHPRPGLIGLSRGGLYCMTWAAAHPEKTLAVYLDNAVCDFKSWPGGKPKGLGVGKGSPVEWAKLLKAFDFTSDAEAIAWKLNPIDNLTPIAKGNIPVFLVYGDSDTVVPAKENSAVLFERYRAMGGPVDQVVKPGQDHHPHGLKDVAPVVAFFNRCLDSKKPGTNP